MTCWGTCIYFTVFCGRLELNIFSMRSVIKKPPTTLLVAATMAMVPRTVDSVLLCWPTNKMAPTTAMASSAFVNDMSGVCRRGEMRRITSNPMKAASMKTYRSVIKSNFINLASSCLRDESRQFVKFANSRIYNFTLPRDQSAANNFIIQIQTRLSFLHQMQKKRAQIAGVHLAGMIRHAAG